MSYTQNVILVCHKFTGAGDAIKPAKIWVINQTACLCRKQLIEGQCSGWFILCDIFADFSPVLRCAARPNQPHD